MNRNVRVKKRPSIDLGIRHERVHAGDHIAFLIAERPRKDVSAKIAAARN